ncbi:MAG TPA: multiheme c-type cytochrome [Gemmatimonadota bacterium]|nr:multiheme c-type cytochrome [Gemmatimonadota bacterium]
MPVLRSFLAGLLLAACSDGGPGRIAPPGFVGAGTCAECHAAQAAAWRGSHHDLAMQEATGEAVLGDFDGATLTYAGITSTFFRRDGRYFVRTDGPDGRLAEYEIAYTFGVEPLQQLLIPFRGGRLQALGIAWDSRPVDQGGQRWFHLYPGETVNHAHELHWTRAAQTWNGGCAACHSTALEKGYDEETDRYTTTWREIDVSCEACHGPGSRHVEWARSGGAEGEAGRGLPVAFHDRRGVRWVVDAKTGIARRSRAPGGRVEVEACGQCHALRSTIRGDHVWGRPLLETHRPELVLSGFYFPDGQILDEVYEYGSFRQSRMYAAGVTCSDCHDPHALDLRADGNAVCAQCHLPSRFDSAGHHLHAPESPGSRCVACHMPERVYMVIDRRRDHSIRIPRPDLADRLGTPSACVACHADRSNAWAAAALERVHGPPGPAPAFVEAFAADDGGFPEAGRSLAEAAADPALPEILEASALARLGSRPGAAPAGLIEAALSDPDPLVRLGAVLAAAGLEVEERLTLAGPALRDSVRGVRQEAARILASVPASALTGELRASFDRAAGEVLAGLAANEDRQWALLDRAAFQAALGDFQAAERSARAAIRLEPLQAQAWIALAEVQLLAGGEEPAERSLRQGLATVGEAADDLQYALGLLLVRRGRPAAAVEPLGRAAGIRPDIPRYLYAYAIALRESGHAARALQVAVRLQALVPDDPDVVRLVEELRTGR